METSTNRPVADKLREAAQLLEQQGANPFRAGLTGVPRTVSMGWSGI